MSFTKQFVLFFLLSLAVFTSCKKNPTQTQTIDLTQAVLTNFELEEVAYSQITITHPVVQNGEEVQQGEIDLVIPKGSTQLQLTPKTSNFTNDQFTITPNLGVKKNFANMPVLYTIAANSNPAKQVHYQVRIREEQDVPAGNGQLTGFTFLKTKNPALPADITSSRIVHGIASIGKVFVFVPLGTNYASLTPTISHNGTALFYSQDPNASPANSTTTYPAEGLAIDFSYPKVFYAIVKTANGNKTYEVVVDVKDPIKLAATTVTTANVVSGSNALINATTYQNQGNHPISVTRITHTNQQPAGLSVLRGVATVPSFGLLPNNSEKIMASVNAQTFPVGTYEVTSTFHPQFVKHPEATDLLLPSSVQLKASIVN